MARREPDAEEVIPLADSPFRGWRGIGLMLLTADLWPPEIRHNAVAAGLLARRRGRHAVTIFILVFWTGVITADLAFFGYCLQTRQPLSMLSFGFLQMIVLPSLVGAWTQAMVAIHLRRTIWLMPIEELVVTRLRPSEIAQGLAVHPLAAQATAVLAESLLHAGLAAATLFHGNYATPGIRNVTIFVMVLYIVVGGLYRWQLCSNANEIAASYALRAHLFLRDAGRANVRMLLDWVRLPVVTILLLTPMLLDWRLVILSGIAILVLSPLTMMRWRAEEVMDYVERFADQWWARTGEDGLAGTLPGSKLLGPWRPPSRPGFRREGTAE